MAPLSMINRVSRQIDLGLDRTSCAGNGWQKRKRSLGLGRTRLRVLASLSCGSRNIVRAPTPPEIANVTVQVVSTDLRGPTATPLAIAQAVAHSGLTDLLVN